MNRSLVGSIYCSFGPDLLTNMATIGNSFFWLFLKKYSPLKPSSQMNRNLVGSTYGRFGIKFSQIPRKNIFDIYVTEYGTALTTILPILFLYLNTVTVTAGTFEP